MEPSNLVRRILNRPISGNEDTAKTKLEDLCKEALGKAGVYFEKGAPESDEVFVTNFSIQPRGTWGCSVQPIPCGQESSRYQACLSMRTGLRCRFEDLEVSLPIIYDPGENFFQTVGTTVTSELQEVILMESTPKFSLQDFIVLRVLEEVCLAIARRLQPEATEL